MCAGGVSGKALCDVDVPSTRNVGRCVSQMRQMICGHRNNNFQTTQLKIQKTAKKLKTAKERRDDSTQSRNAKQKDGQNKRTKCKAAGAASRVFAFGATVQRAEKPSSDQTACSAM